MPSRRGPDLPYFTVAGVTPRGRRWLAGTAKINGATFAPEEPKIYDSFADVLDERPSFTSIVVNAPVGYADTPGMGGRTCDRAARALLGRRGIAVHSPPTRAVLLGETPWREDHLDAVSATLLPRYMEVAAEMSPYRQRTVYEGHPELSFYQLNGDVPLQWGKNSDAGRQERRLVLEKKIPGITRIIDSEIVGVAEKQLLDVAALLWTARRVYGHAAKRIPQDAEWDSEGLRMEFVL
jgi:predicted RNase H-like nuclease